MECLQVNKILSNVHNYGLLIIATYVDDGLFICNDIRKYEGLMNLKQNPASSPVGNYLSVQKHLRVFYYST